MKVLVIEDDLNKSAVLREYVASVYPDAAIDERRSYQSGLRRAIASPPDVILLDMTMPTFDVSPTEQGGRTRTYGGRDILAELSRRGVPVRVIVVTQFESFGEGGEAMTLEQLNAQLRNRFGRMYLGMVYYQPAEGAWKARVGELLALSSGA